MKTEVLLCSVACVPEGYLLNNSNGFTIARFSLTKYECKIFYSCTVEWVPVVPDTPSVTLCYHTQQRRTCNTCSPRNFASVYNCLVLPSMSFNCWWLSFVSHRLRKCAWRLCSRIRLQTRSLRSWRRYLLQSFPLPSGLPFKEWRSIGRPPACGVDVRNCFPPRIVGFHQSLRLNIIRITLVLLL